MLSQDLLLQQAQNRKAQRTPIALSAILKHIHKQDYQNLIEWICESSAIMDLSCSTRFLARTFLDWAILDPQVIPYDHYILLALAALAIAIKFNESREVSEKITLQYLLKSVNMFLSKPDLIRLETRVLRSVSNILAYTSPNDYLDIYMETLPLFLKLRHVIPKFIELALIRPNACQFTAEQQFFGSVLAILQRHKLNLSKVQQNVLLSLTNCWQKAQAVASMIFQAILVAQNELISQ